MINVRMIYTMRNDLRRMIYKMHRIVKRKTNFLNKKQYIFKKKETNFLNIEQKHAGDGCQTLEDFVSGVFVFTLNIVRCMALISGPVTIYRGQSCI